MAQKNKKKDSHGYEFFSNYYECLYKKRWQVLKESLFLEPCYVKINFSSSEEKLDDYFLDIASVVAASCLPLQNATKILDLCAAPGGKTLVLAKLMNDDCFLTSNEYSRERYKRLCSVVQKCLPEKIQERVKQTCFDGATWCKFEKEAYDSILLDAPCSSERHVIQDEKYLNEWSESRIKMLSMKQWSLLSSAFISLKACGYLLYSTCALSEKENDGVVKRLFSKYKNVTLEEINFELFENDVKEKLGIDIVLPVIEKTEYGYHILPDSASGAGPLYFSLIKKHSMD